MFPKVNSLIPIERVGLRPQENDMTLELNNEKITVAPGRLVYNQTRVKYISLADSAAERFGSSYHATFKNMDDVHKHCTEIAYSFVREAVEVALQDLVKLGIYDIDNNAFYDFLEPYFTWPEDFSKIDDAYMEIVLKAGELDAYRTERRQSRGRWVGGGFGISGAVKGALYAGAANAATNLLHGGVNMLAKGVSAIADENKKQELFKNPQTRTGLVASVHRAVFNVHFALIDAVNKSKPGSFVDLVTDEAQTRAERLLQNVKSGRLPQDAVQGALLDALNLDPYNEKFYRLWFGTFGDQNGQLEQVESFFGVAVVSRIKQDLISSRKVTLDLSTPEACEASLKTLTDYAESIGYRGFSTEKNQILALAKKLDQERRTVDGREYRTLEEARAAKEEIRVETIRRDNTLTSSGQDLLKVAAAIICLLVAIGAMLDKKPFVWVALAFGLSVLALQAVRSVRIMKFSRGIGYVISAIGSIVAITELGAAVIDKGSDSSSGLPGAFVCLAVGWGIVRLMRLRYQEAGHGNLKDHFPHALIVGAIIGGLLVGVMAFVGKNKQPETSNAATVSAPPPAPAKTLPASASTLIPPKSAIAFTDLYGIEGVAGDKVTLPSGEEALVWYASSITTDSGPRYLVMVARTNPNETSNADSGKVDAVTYHEEAGQWKVDAKSRELFRTGSFGVAAPLTKDDLAKVEHHLLKPGATGLFLPGGSSGQGYSTAYFDVISLSGGAIEYLGQVEIGGENSGACDSTVKDGPGACYSWTGTVQIEPSRNGQPGDILVRKTGSENVDSQLVPAQQARWVWTSGKGYAAS
jgi:hypothetical protein